MSKHSPEKINNLLKDNPFPVTTTDPNIKSTKEFGMKVAKNIYYKGISEDQSSGRRKIAQENREFASNRNDPDAYKGLLDATIDNEGDESYMNIDWSIQHPGKKFTDIIVGDMINQDHKLQFNAIDSNSKQNLRKDRDEFYGKIVKARDIAAMEQASGLTLHKKGDFQPQSKEEIDIYMDMEYKQAIEIGMEGIVGYELVNNDWEKKIKKKVVRDFVENNYGGVRLYFDKNNKIKIRYVDAPLNVYTSATDEPDFSDTEYEAEMTTLSLGDLRKRDCHNEVSEEQWFKIAKDAALKNKNPGWKFGDTYNSSHSYDGSEYAFNDYRIEVLDFIFYTTDKMIWEEKSDKFGGKHMSRKDYNYKKPERSKKSIEVIEKEIEMSYEGIWIVNSDILLGYEKTKNILRPKEDDNCISPKLLHRYILFQPNMRDGTSSSFIDVIKPNLNTIQLLVLRKRHLIAEMTPVGAAYDVSGLKDVMSALKEDNPMNIVKLYKQKGILFYSRTDVNGDPVNGAPVHELNNNFANQLNAINNAIITEVEQIRDNTGINEARDGSTPDKDALVGIEKMRLLASNNTTRETYKGFLDGVFAPIGRVMSRMIQYKVEYGDGIKEYDNIIGELGVKAVEFAKDLPMARMGIIVEALPTDDQIQQLLDMLNISLTNKEIRPEDYLEVKREMNVKKGERLLVYRRKEYAKQQIAEFEQREQITAEREAKSAMAAAEAEKIKQVARAEAEMSIKEREYALKNKLAVIEAEEKLKLIDREGYWKERLIEKASEEEDETKDNVDAPKIFSDPAGAAVRQGTVNP